MTQHIVINPAQVDFILAEFYNPHSDLIDVRALDDSFPMDGLPSKAYRLLRLRCLEVAQYHNSTRGELYSTERGWFRTILSFMF